MDNDTVTSFVEDAITELEKRNARDVVEYLRMMLECDGPDVDGAVSSLVAYGAVFNGVVGVTLFEFCDGVLNKRCHRVMIHALTLADVLVFGRAVSPQDG